MSSKSELWDIEFVDLAILNKKICSYAKDGYASIWFLGWDISIHPKIIEIISQCKKSLFESINIISNWMRFDDFEFAREVVNAWLTRINLSVHSHLDTIEDYLIQVPWWLQRKLKAIDNLKKLYNKWLLKDDISINIVLNSKNLWTITETILYFNKAKGINDFRINFIWLSDNVKENWNDLKISYTEFLPHLRRLIYISEKYHIRITFDTVPACIFYKINAWEHRAIIKKYLWEDQDHIVQVDHIHNNDAFDWKERKKSLLKIQFPQCARCEYNTSCQWVWKSYWELYWWSEIIPIIT